MRFYYISIVSVFLLILIWSVGTGLLVWLGSRLRRTRKRIWPVMVPLFLILYIGPIAEELWIARNFGQLCKKDAGIFIYKTVEVEGFYDATRPTHPNARSKVAADDLNKGGYQFYEMPLPDFKGGPTRAVHLEKVNGEWTPTVLEQPSARYHYEKDSGVRITHKVYRQSSRVFDAETQEVLGQYIRFSREGSWYFVSLGDPGLGCDGPDGGPATQHSFLIYRDVLKPIGPTKREEE